MASMVAIISSDDEMNLFSLRIVKVCAAISFPTVKIRLFLCDCDVSSVKHRLRSAGVIDCCG